MTSFVREILSASGTLGEKENLCMKAARLKKQIEEKKIEMRKEMEGKYEEYQSSFIETSTLLSQLESTLEEVNTLRNTVNLHLKPEMQQSTSEMNDLLQQLQELSATVEVVNKMKKVYEDTATVNEALDCQNYLKAASMLKEIELVIHSKDLDDLSQEDPDQVKAFKAAKVEFVTALEKTHFALGQEWDTLYQFEEQGEGNVEKLIVSPNMRQKSALLSAMVCVDMLDYRVSKLAQKIQTDFLRDLISRKTDITVNAGCIILEKKNSIPDPLDALQNLSLFFKFIQTGFDVEFQTSDEQTSLFHLIGQCISEDFLELLIKSCLAPAIPSSKEDLKHFEEVKKEAEELESFLKQTRFLEESNQSLLSYAANIDDVFAQKRVATILAKARELMKEELHNTTKNYETKPFADEEFIEKLDNLKTEINAIPVLEDLNLPEGFSFDDCIFRFPNCEISRNVNKILGLVHDTLDEASCSSPALAGKLFYAARLIFELYCDVLPIYHKQALEQFPQHSALALTNCMYLAYQCSILGFEYKERLPNDLKEQFLTFADLIVKVRNVGIDLFLAQLRTQRNILNETLVESGFDQLQGEAQLPPKAEQGLKQVLHHLNRLRSVWQHVLPPHIYSRSIGVLLNYVCDRLIDQVVRLEDIAADTATQISTLFTSMESKAPELFVIESDKRSSKHDVVRFVRSWQKFKELILVLNANLREIDDRWSSGKGPLAVEFSVDEMKQLIRALFQNTDRRAAVLAKIKFDG